VQAERDRQLLLHHQPEPLALLLLFLQEWQVPLLRQVQLLLFQLGWQELNSQQH
jgi:hypothetical protein